MTEERIAYFTRKITESNRSGIIVAMYEIFFEYLDESTGDKGVLVGPVRKAGTVLEHLKDALDFSYEISNNLFALYDFCQRMLAKAIYKNSAEPLDIARKIMSELYESFVEVAKTDTSETMMKSTQKVTAGMTYGRNSLTETVNDNNRGFLA